MAFTYSNKKEIDHRTIKLLIGLIALTLGNITSFLSMSQITSISESYYFEPWPRNIFVGFLFAVSAFLLAYNGYSKGEMIISKIAALGALGVALFPCACDCHKEIIPHVHYISAAVLFVILAIFCRIFYKRAMQKDHKEAKLRAAVYVVCGITILVSIALILIDALSHDRLTHLYSRLTFQCERAGLVAFGVSWLVASRVLPFISARNERYNPFV